MEQLLTIIVLIVTTFMTSENTVLDLHLVLPTVVY